ncbi:hypothetical protein M9H77_36657 [Catharanthus roseus]|uniref:Uncharacterized protein n=1 Tax=Catharanthus roseus TaxID=4058 RepID=A0ACB9ZUM3_CATRO|nr:hypothetical protein M9H77_36657 [Catharanthus roseus]
MRKLVFSLIFLAIFLRTSGICNAGHGGPSEGRDQGRGRNDHGGRGGGRGGDEGHVGHFGLTMNYYHKSCRSDVEAIVRDIVWRNVSANPSLPAKLLRLHYHDCFVRGCDASILLDSTPGNQAEKDAGPNRSVTGYELIDFIKETLEKLCPEIVSCADIIALAARDAVSFQFQRPMWPVFTGREDGRISQSADAVAGLPSASADFATLLANFNSNGLDIVDLVTLSGAHTIGITHCSLLSRRLYNFTGNGDTDPTLNPEYVKTLKKICPLPIISSTLVEMDPQSSTNFDNHYYVALKQNKGIFRSDAALLTDPKSVALVQLFQNPILFFESFARSVIKMGEVGVLINGQGEIRKNCRVVN